MNESMRCDGRKRGEEGLGVWGSGVVGFRE